MERQKKFADLSIAIKLNAVQSAALVVLFAATIAILSSWLSTTLEQRSLAEVQKTNRLVVDMIDVYAASLEQSAEKLGATLASFFPKEFTLDESALGIGSMSVLKHGGAVVNLDFTIVDRFTSITGAVATVFARQGDDFVRVSTSLQKEDGERAVRTFLGKAHLGFAKLMRGEAFTGKAKLFGRDYLTRYLPVVDETGRTMAVLFIGVDFTNGLKALKKKILGIKIGETGYRSRHRSEKTR